MLCGNGVEMTCTVIHEQLTASGECQKKSVHKIAVVSLGRNEFRDVVLKLVAGRVDYTYVLHCRDSPVVVHRKFASEGKATLRLPAKRVQLLLSNCPPSALQAFLRTVVGKLSVQRAGCTGPGCTGPDARARLLSGRQQAFNEISPLSVKDVQTVTAARVKEAEQRLLTEKNTSSSSSLKTKRKREADAEKENRPPKGLRTACGKPVCGQQGALRSAVVLTVEQKRVLQTVLSGRSVFFTGSAGTGKSFLLRKIIASLAPEHTFATASTGVAACHIGGTTVHAFAGMGSGGGTLLQCVQLASREAVARNWRRCKHLVIDEVSMIDADFFDKLEAVARAVRKTDEPFGGIQLILCGDFLQLPPVTKKAEKRKFAFQSRAWSKCVQTYMELTEVRRQADSHFIEILQAIRLGRCPEWACEALSATSAHQVERGGIVATRLCTHKEDVDAINRLQLGTLGGASRHFVATDSDPAMASRLDSQCPVKQRLELKEAAQVMLAKNLAVGKGLVNGARGVVIGFDATTGCPRIRFMSGELVTIERERWSVKAPGGGYVTRRQLPLQLAWAISIHKSQGMSLDCVELSLARVFECGQAYVALSRATDMRGLRVLDFNRACVRADPDVLHFYERMQRAQGT